MSVKLLKPTMYSEGAMNSMVAFWTSGLLCGSPYDLLTGLYINSSGTTHRHTHNKTVYYMYFVCNSILNHECEGKVRGGDNYAETIYILNIQQLEKCIGVVLVCKLKLFKDYNN